jgi:antirestriction protein
MKTTIETAKLFVTDYASYNEGLQFKHGHWVDLSQFNDADEFNDYLNEHFEKCNIEYPEIMFTDFEGFPKKFYSESYDSNLISELFDYLNILKGCFNEEALYEYVNAGYDANDFDEAYSGRFDSDADFAENLADELGYLDKNVSWPYTCIDWEWAARDLMYDYFEVGGYYFRNL